MPRILLALAAAALLLAPSLAAAAPRRTVSVAAAANLKLAMEALARGFEAGHPGVTVAVTLGASGALFAQLQNGAPVDAFFSADVEYPRRLVEAGLGDARDEVVYAIGTLVIWAPRGSLLDLEGKGVAAVADPAVRRLAIANPAVAPYGRAAEAALDAAGVHDAVRARLVLGQSVAQTAQFARSGAADAAFLPRSLTLSPELRDGKILVVPPATYPPQRQAALVLRGAREPELARAFVRYTTGPEGRAILARHGYGLP
jgi:molybdate transport system substrate-binding protein